MFFKRVLLVVLVFSVVVLWSYHSASALSVPTTTTSCSSFSASGSSASGYVVIGVISGTHGFPGAIVPVINGTFSGSITFPAQVSGTFLNYFVYESTSQGYVAGATFVTSHNCSNTSGSSQGQPQFFNPGDGRVDPRPGDRLAIYCRASGIDVWGVTDQSRGLHLMYFSAEQIAAAKHTTLSITTVNGQVTLGLDSSGNFRIVWQGGMYHATGVGDFVKNGSCLG